ncbi:MAG: class I SAM-dependent methyltransferase [Candidatus Gottesmanbacteria bacterium]
MEKQGYRLYRCPACKLTVTEFTKQYTSFVKQFYSKGYFTGDPRCSAFSGYEKDKLCVTRNLQQVLQRVKKYVPNDAKILDAGCAMGFMVELARLQGYNAYGFDPSSYALSRATSAIKQYLSKATIETASYPKNSFDAITLTDIIEHTQDPVRSMNSLRQFLKCDGYIVIATGDTQSLAAKLLGKHWTFYIPPQHLVFLSKDNLTTMLRAAGFTPVSWFRIGKWLSLDYIVHLAQSAGDYWWARYIHFVVKWLHIGKLPIYLPMQDNMVVIARKTN